MEVFGQPTNEPLAATAATTRLDDRDFAVIGLALRVLLATATPQDPFYDDARRACEKLSMRHRGMRCLAAAQVPAG